MRRIGKARRRPPAVRPRDRDGGFPRLSDGVAHGSRCPASPRHALLAENLGKPSLGVNIMDLWYNLVTVKYSCFDYEFYDWRSIGADNKFLKMSRFPGQRRSASRHVPASKFDRAPQALYAMGPEK